MAVIDWLTQHFPPRVSPSLAVLTALITVTIVSSILHQTFFKDPSKPPVVFHWVPFIGSTVTYGIDPYKFFLDSQAKVGAPKIMAARLELMWSIVWQRLYLHPTRQKSHSLPGSKRQPVHPQWKAERSERGRDILGLDNTGLWEGCGV